MIAAIWGPEKSWKSTMALTFPKPMYHFDLDIGGFGRAAWRLKPEELAQVESKSYPTPIQLEKLIGQVKDGPSIRFPKKLFGIKEVWQRIVVDFVAACNNPKFLSIAFDSATQLWFICHRGFLQEVQERQVYRYLHNKDGNLIPGREEKNFPGNEFREKLQSIEYGDPNDRMRSLIYAARSFGKHLILTHYPRDVYGQRLTDRGIEEYKTGEIEPDGFKDTQKLVDIVIWVDVAKTGDDAGKAFGKITKCGLEGLGTAANGLSIEPSYQGIMNLQRSMTEG